MKKLIKRFSLILSLFFFQQTLFAQNKNNNEYKEKYEFVRNKTINKSYTVSSSDKLSIKNSFGDVKVHTWTKNEIKVDVSIEASSNKESIAQKIIDGIDVSESMRGSEISFRTTIKGVNNSKGEKSSMKVNYEVYMPAANPLKINNEFGGIDVPDWKGEVELTSKFGSLKAGALSNVKSVDVEFGSANIESITDAPISVKYSTAEFGKLSGNIKLNLEFSTATKINLDNSLTSLDASVSYSSLNLKPISDLAASYNISTSFGGFKNRTSISFDSDEDDDKNKGPKFDFKYNGKSGSGTVPIKINASFGDIILGEPNADDLKEKGTKKKKTATI